MTRWRTDDLTAAAANTGGWGGLGSFSLSRQGSLHAYVTPWNAISIVGTDAGPPPPIGTDDTGRPLTLWWAPGFGGRWRMDYLDSSAQAPQIDDESITTLVTPWNATTVFGIGDVPPLQSGTIPPLMAYWWTPAAGRWQHQEILVNSARVPLGASDVQLDSETIGNMLALFGRRTDNGHLVCLSWMPGSGSAWNLIDITAAVA